MKGCSGLGGPLTKGHGVHLVKLNEADLERLGNLDQIEVTAEDGTRHTPDGAELGRSSLGYMVDGEAVAYGDLLLTYP